MSEPEAQNGPAPGLAYFHIPLPEFKCFDSSNFTGVKQESISSPSVNSGFFTTMVAAGDVRAAFIGHDHVNDFCGELNGIQLCYAGGFGYHAYGKAGWSRRARVVVASLEKTENGGWGAVKSIKTWKRLDDQHLTAIDGEVLWFKRYSGKIFLHDDACDSVREKLLSCPLNGQTCSLGGYSNKPGHVILSFLLVLLFFYVCV